MDLRRAIPVFASGTLLLIAASCGSGGGSTSSFYTVPNNIPKPADTINRAASPQPRSDALTYHLAQYRSEALGASAALFQARHDDVMYTAAVRHAIYLNSINSAAVPAYGGGPETATITAETAYETLITEPVTGGSPWPMLYTSSDLLARVQAVYGGTALLNSIGADRYLVDELYLFDGDVWRSTGTISDFRSYAASAADPVESAWYQRRGRQHLMRASLVYFGYGAKADPVPNGVVATPPYPILNNRFVGALTVVHARPLAGAQGWWPNNNNQNVNPYGLDTDMGGTEQYSGPPIHITLPVAEPLMITNGVLALDLTRVDQYDGVAVSPTFPYSQTTWRRFRVFSNVENLQITSTTDPVGGFTVAGTPAPVISNAPMLYANRIDYGPPPPTVYLTYAIYRINFGGGIDLGSAASPLVEIGDTLRIKVENKANPLPTTASVGEFSYDIVNVNYDSKWVEVNVPVFRWENDYPVPPFESSPTTPATEMIRYGNVENVSLSVYKPTGGRFVAEVDDVMSLTNGEMMLVPIAPLEKNSWYRFRFQLRTPSFDTGLKTVFFKTNGRSY
jgi:hypothetical protein